MPYTFRQTHCIPIPNLRNDLCVEKRLIRDPVYIRVNNVILQCGHSTNFIGVINLGKMNYSVHNKSKL